MSGIFLKLLNMSIAASWLVLAVIFLRFCLKKAPKWIICLLWGIVALRLVMPFSLRSVFSLIPSAQVIPSDIASTENPAIYSGVPSVNSAVNPYFVTHLQEQNTLETILFAASAVWLAGVVIMLVYGAVSYLRLCRQVSASVLYRDRIYVCDDISSPFLLGVFRPKIYIPSGMDAVHLQYVLAHENAHIRRKDHWWKPMSYLLLTVYWFNPLLWLAHILLCRDIERACDEKVIADMDNTGKKGYSEALVACSIHRRTVMACPVAFGEVSVKARIKGIIAYKRPGFWLLVVSAVACIVTAVCFLTDPNPCVHVYHSEIAVSATCTEKGMDTYTCELCRHSYAQGTLMLEHAYDEGTLVEAPTCTHDGVKELHCTDCSAIKMEAVERIAHTAGELTLSKEPNCTQKGEMTSTCTACQKVYVAEIFDTNDVHDMKQTVLRAATCSEDGEAVETCSRCGLSNNCVLQRHGHTYSIVSEGKPLCTLPAIRIKRCAVCATEVWEEIPPDPDNHAWMDMGLYWPDQCRNCGSIKPDSQVQKTEDWVQDLYAPPATKTPEDLLPVIRWDLGAP